MEHFFVLLISGVSSFFGHHFGERFFDKNKTAKLVLKGYQIHHSFFGLIALLLAFISSGIYALALVGYGIGNIWHHKKTHNNVNEKGMVFITKDQTNLT